MQGVPLSPSCVSAHPGPPELCVCVTTSCSWVAASCVWHWLNNSHRAVCELQGLGALSSCSLSLQWGGKCPEESFPEVILSLNRVLSQQSHSEWICGFEKMAKEYLREASGSEDVKVGTGDGQLVCGIMCLSSINLTNCAVGWEVQVLSQVTRKSFCINSRVVWVKDNLVPALPCLGQGCHSLDQVVPSRLQPGLEHFQRLVSHSFSGQPTVQIFTEMYLHF